MLSTISASKDLLTEMIMPLLPCVSGDGDRDEYDLCE